ncbi:MAG TPA: copper homeostasis protein CutC, partial [Christiangramia sp.]|nr:copper homeostasis protein CutC [Christiangramia sp.]
MIIEVCTNSLESAINAERGGADRIELCSELGVGGITPSFGLIKAALEKISIPIHVLIRPRSGDFTYSEYDFQVMLQDIEECRNLGVSGIVSGVLNEDFSPDLKRTGNLINASTGMSFTFH